ncbi:MAG: hypothetical protein WC736_14645 [Gallionella sp.]|jgi:hypothetical protein
MTPEEARLFAENGHDAMWRICDSGMYKIMIKDVEGNPSGVIPFKANRTQRRFIQRMWYRNLTLKARQLGMTTLVCIMWLDYALFNRNVRCGIVAQDDTSATAFFRDKVKFAYDNLDPEIKAMFPIRSSNTNELLFAHEMGDSSIRVATSFASATLHRLLVSEYAKICAKYPEKANEVVIGTIPTVPENGVVIIESTGEGAEGDFFERVKKAEKLEQEKRALTPKDFRLHFFPWFIDAAYEMDPTGVIITPDLNKYFSSVEAEMSTVLSDRKRAWYAATLEGSFTGDQEQMFSQYPSTPNEPFFVSTEGNYHRRVMAVARKQGRICKIPTLAIPTNTFWDVGNSDGTAIWFHQQVGMEDRFIDYFEAHGNDDTQLDKLAEMLQKKGFIYNKHFLPHDAFHKRQNDKNESIAEILERLLPGQKFEMVDKPTTLVQGIQIVWNQFPTAHFDETNCQLGISRIDGYKKKWNARDGKYSDEPDKSNDCSEGADALRQWAQAKARGNVTMAGTTRQSSGFGRDAPDWRL